MEPEIEANGPQSQISAQTKIQPTPTVLELRNIECWIVFHDHAVVREISVLPGAEATNLMVANVKLALPRKNQRTYEVHWKAKSPITALCDVRVTYASTKLAPNAARCAMYANVPCTQIRSTRDHTFKSKNLLTGIGAINDPHKKGQVCLEIRRACGVDSPGSKLPALQCIESDNPATGMPPYAKFVFMFERLHDDRTIKEEMAQSSIGSRSTAPALCLTPAHTSTRMDDPPPFPILMPEVKATQFLNDGGGALPILQLTPNRVLANIGGSNPHPHSASLPASSFYEGLKYIGRKPQFGLASVSGSILDVKKKRGLEVEKQSSELGIEQDHAEKRQKLSLSISSSPSKDGLLKCDQRHNSDETEKRREIGSCGLDEHLASGSQGEAIAASQNIRRKKQGHDHDNTSCDRNDDDIQCLIQENEILETEIRAAREELTCVRQRAEYLESKLVHIKLKAEIRAARLHYASFNSNIDAVVEAETCEDDQSDSESTETLLSFSRKNTELEIKIATDRKLLSLLRQKTRYRENKITCAKLKAEILDTELLCKRLQSDVAAASHDLKASQPGPTDVSGPSD